MQVSSATTRPYNSGISLLWKPMGYPMNQELNDVGINQWAEQTQPGILKKSTPLTIGGLISSAIGILSGFVAIGDRKPLYPSLFLLLVGIGSTILGIFGNPIGKQQNLEAVKYEPYSLELEANDMSEHLAPHDKSQGIIPVYEPPKQTLHKAVVNTSSAPALSIYSSDDDPPKAG